MTSSIDVVCSCFMECDVMQKYTSIQLRPETKELLFRLKDVGESYEDYLLRVLPR